MDSAKLKKMISRQEGGMKGFSTRVGIANTTLFDSLASDERLNKMPISNFMKIAHAFDMSVDELADYLGYEK